MNCTLEPMTANDHDALELRNRQINAVHTISRQLSSTLDLDERLREILKVSMQAVDADAGTIFLYRPADDKLIFSHVVGPKAPELTGIAIPATQGLAGSVFRSGEPEITNRPRDTPEFNPDLDAKSGFYTESIVTVPLKYQAGRPVGVMQILNKQTGEFSHSDLEVLEIIASIAATAIENAQLHRDAQLSAVAHAVGDLSHDIKNKVAPISGFVETLQPMFDDMYAEIDQIKPSIPREAADNLDRATGAPRDLYPEAFKIILDQVNEVQEFTKLIADAVRGIVSEPQLDPHEPDHVITRQLDSLEPIARNRRINLVRDLIPVPTCRFDRFLVERAVYNLVNNAIPETPEGGTITVRTRFSDAGSFPSGSYLLIEVEDTGTGMPTHVLERILRGDAKSTKPGGTGLGTRIVYNAVAAHHGLFEGESKEGFGTTFRLKLPLLQE